MAHPGPLDPHGPSYSLYAKALSTSGHTYTRTHAHAHTQAHTHMHAHTHAHTHIHMSTHMHARMAKNAMPLNNLNLRALPAHASTLVYPYMWTCVRATDF